MKIGDYEVINDERGTCFYYKKTKRKKPDRMTISFPDTETEHIKIDFEKAYGYITVGNTQYVKLNENGEWQEFCAICDDEEEDKKIEKLDIQLSPDDENKVNVYRANNLECDLAFKINEIIEVLNERL